MMNRFDSVVFFVAALMCVAVGWMGCGDDETAHDDLDCPDDECVDCDTDDDCPESAYCHGEAEVCVKIDCEDHDDCPERAHCLSDDEVCVQTECEVFQNCPVGTYCDKSEGLCFPMGCEPGSDLCNDDKDGLLRCNYPGDAYTEIKCDTGMCEDGQCVCESDDDCADGAVCSDGQCDCPSETWCGELCCGGDEICAETEVCDDDGDCDTIQECRPECQGQVCGLDGELCCEGDTPVCGPDGDCAPDCSGEGQLCGDDFDECCPDGDVCVYGECRSPGSACDDFADCDFDQYCDEAIGHCLPDEFPEDLICEEDVDFDPFDVDELWHWDGVEVDGVMHANVATTPMVADLTQDGGPEVVFSAFADDSPAQGVLVVADGEDGTTKYVNDELSLRSHSHNAVGAIDGQGPAQIVVSTDQGIAMIDDLVSCPDPEDDDDGCVVWQATLQSTSINQAPSLADVTGDGNLEVIHLHSVFDGETGDVVASAPQGQASMSVAVDLDGDGELEILTSGCAFHVEDGESQLQPKWCNSDLPGHGTREAGARNYVGVGDVVGDDRQGRAEVVWVGDGDVFLVDEEGDILHEFDLPGAFRGGPPVVADFDGDGSAEFGVGGQSCYTVFDLDCLDSDDEDQPGCERPEFEECTPGEDCVVEPCPDVEDGTGDGILWSIEIVDSVTQTGFASAVFDFQGDGRHEVVYGDHCRVFVLDGRTGQPQMTQLASRRANSEMPTVVDVDGDGRSNLLVQANSDRFDRDCVDPIQERPDYFPECHGDDPPEFCTEGNQGVFALRDVHDSWVSTESLWNQHAYHITNIDDDLSAPDTWQPPWSEFNTFRASRQGEVPLNAADPVITSVQINARMCPPDIEVVATIENAGMSGIPEGMPVSLYRYDDSGQGQLVATELLEEAVSPGGVTMVEFAYEVGVDEINVDLDFQVVANDDGEGGAPIADCNPDDASKMVEKVECSVQL